MQLLHSVFDKALNYLRDVILAPVWAWTHIDKDSLAGAVVTAATGPLATAILGGLCWLFWRAIRALQRAGDAARIAKAKADAPKAVLIIIADFAGEGRRARWGDEIAERLRTDFVDFAPGSSVLTERWTRRYAGNGAAKAARRDLAKFGGDLMLWGKALKGGEIKVEIATRDSGRAPARLAFGEAKRTEEGAGKLTQEMGDSLTFFAAEAAGKSPADLAEISAKPLVALAEKLCALVAKPPKGLTAAQLEAIELAFDRAGFAALNRAFPSEEVAKSLMARRRWEVGEDGLERAYVLLEQGLPLSLELKRFVEAAANDDQAGERALTLRAKILAGQDEYELALQAARAALAAARTPGDRVVALTILSDVNRKVGLREPGPPGWARLDEAIKAGVEACEHADPTFLAHAEAYVSAIDAHAQAFRRGQHGRYQALDARIEALIAQAARRCDSNFVPRACAMISFAEAQALLAMTYSGSQSATEDFYERSAKAARSGLFLLPPLAQIQLRQVLLAVLSDTLSNLGLFRHSPELLAEAISHAEAAVALDGSPAGWATLALARQNRGELLAEAEAGAAEARREAEAALQTLRERVLPNVSVKQDGANYAVFREYEGSSLRLLARLTPSSAEAAALYREAASALGEAARVYAEFGDSREAERFANEAAACENLARGESEAATKRSQ